MADDSPAGVPADASGDQPTSVPAAGPFTPPKLVFVAGATGRTGQRVVRELVKRGVSVRAGVRSMEKGQAALKELGVDESKVELVSDVDECECTGGQVGGWVGGWVHACVHVWKRARWS